MADLPKIISDSLVESSDVSSLMSKDEKFIESLHRAANFVIDTYKNKGKVLLAGNGGSAADSQHIAAEFIGRLNFDRDTLPAIALTTNTSNLTCIANDYGYDDIFVRQMNALAQKNDCIIVYTTSGTSNNIIKLIENAKGKVKSIIALTGEHTSDLEKYADIVISVKSKKTTRIQEIHAIAGHVICECVEETLFR